jgi:hypothetical protein
VSSVLIQAPPSCTSRKGTLDHALNLACFCSSHTLLASCRKGKILCNKEHDDYPALAAEILDFLAVAGHRPRALSDRMHELFCPPPRNENKPGLERGDIARRVEEANPDAEKSEELSVHETTMDGGTAHADMNNLSQQEHETVSEMQVADGDAGMSGPTAVTGTPTAVEPAQSQAAAISGMPSNTPPAKTRCSGLHVSANQVADFLSREPLVLRHVNTCRTSLGLPRLLA